MCPVAAVRLGGAPKPVRKLMKNQPGLVGHFPQGKRKALVMSYDDGSEHDRRLVTVLNEYGLRATFHLNSGRLGTPYHISKGEVLALYRGHEVAAHGANHLDFVTLSNEQIDREIGDDLKVLEDLVSAPVRGFAYPFGSYDERVIACLSPFNLAYGRTADSTGWFELPERPLTLRASCHHNRALELGARFLKHDAGEMALLHVWGHSFEFDGFLSADPSKDWRYLEAFCRLLGGQPDIYYATTFDVVDYLTAARALVDAPVAEEVRNDTHRTIWLSHGKRLLELSPGEKLDLTAGLSTHLRPRSNPNAFFK